MKHAKGVPKSPSKQDRLGDSVNLEKTQRRGCRGGEKIRKGRRENGRKCALLPASGREQLAALRC